MSTEAALDVLVGGTALDHLKGRGGTAPHGENPGIGGTEWTLLGVAHLLRAAGMDVRVIVDSGSPGPERVEFEVVACESFDALLAEPDRVTLTSQAVAQSLSGAWAGRGLIVGLHHPHVQNSINFFSVLRLRPAAFVSVGQYAWASNLTFGIPHVWIPNPFPRWALTSRSQSLERSSDSGHVLGFVGALLPAKGFHHIAAAWGNIRAALPEARLEVVGSSSLYGYGDGHGDLPTVPGYGDQILRALGPHRDSVTFLGLVKEGKSAVYAGWDAAILNPTGTSEADPSSLKEVVAAGVPVAAGADFGMWDIMRFLPDLVITQPDPQRIAEVALSAALDGAVRDRFLVARERLLSDSLARDDRLAEAWMSLISTVAEGRSRSASACGFRPARPTGAVGRRLILRNMLGPVLWLQALGRAARVRVRAVRRWGRRVAP